MVKTKKFKEEGQVIEVEEEQVPVIEISQNQAKKLTKKPMSEKQQENIKKLVEANRQKWALKKTEMEAKKEMESEGKVKVVVKPKRIYPSRKKAVAPVSESESASESEEEPEVEKYQKTKAKAKPKRSKSDEPNELKQKLDQLENKIKENQSTTIGFR